MSEQPIALCVPITEDLTPLSVLLHRQGVAHRIFEQDGQQVVQVADAAAVEPVQRLYEAWRAGEVDIQLSRSASTPDFGWRLLLQWQRIPVTMLLLLLSVFGFLVMYLPQFEGFEALFTFTPFSVVGSTMFIESLNHQYWRLVTPAFLHFDWLHIVFNGLWLWELGGRVERVMGHFNMLMLFLVMAIVSNFCQYSFGGPGLFGGMSGVVYGLLAFSWVAPLLQPRWQMQPPAPVMLFMLGWLVLWFIIDTRALGIGGIANAAHLGGLLCGAALGALFGALSPSGRDNPPSPSV